MLLANNCRLCLCKIIRIQLPVTQQFTIGGDYKHVFLMQYSEWISTARLHIYPFQLACHMCRPVPINNVLDLTCKLYKFKWPANLRGKVPFSGRPPPPPRGFSSDTTVAPRLRVSISPLTLKFRAAPANSNLNFTVGIYISLQFEHHLSRLRSRGTNDRPLRFDIQHDD